MAKLRKVHQVDYSRVLLTEVLPYEVPIIFSNEGYYDFVKENPECPDLVKDMFSPNFQVAFNYRIKKNAFAHRTLSIMHPTSQRRFIDFYKNYDLLIIHLCSKSPISLRYPSQVASRFYEKSYSETVSDIKEESVDIEVNYEEGIKEKTANCSYFKYKSYNLLLKFYDSYEFIRLEKKFKYLLKFDISNCFSSIYTHSISWAVKDKMFAKSYKSRSSFEKTFDELMQHANHSETHGILIGPEISRIFAEIILQKIDLNVIAKLEEGGIIRKNQYDIRRYVDDYFVFTNDENIGKEILKVFSEELEAYKLYINESKTSTTKVPFISGITIARNSVRNILKTFFSNFSSYNDFQDEEIESESSISIASKRRSTYKFSNKLIVDLKCIVKANNVVFEDISRLSLAIVKNELNKLYKKINSKSLNNDQYNTLSKFLLNVFDFLFFLYSMDNCVRITYVMTQIIVSTNKFLESFPLDQKHNIKKKIFDESIFLIRNIKSEEGLLTVEILNLLIAMKDLGEEYYLEEEVLTEIIDFAFGKELCYFHYIVLLYYIADNSKYNNARNIIEDRLITLFQDETHPREKTETICLFFDVISCPFLSDGCKNSIIETVFQKVKGLVPKEDNRNKIKNFVSNKRWFVDWSEDLNLEQILSKKELITPY